MEAWRQIKKISESGCSMLLFFSFLRISKEKKDKTIKRDAPKAKVKTKTSYEKKTTWFFNVNSSFISHLFISSS
jgi:hypothetical protein